jgi:hypothetical protein
MVIREPFISPAVTVSSRFSEIILLQPIYYSHRSIYSCTCITYVIVLHYVVVTCSFCAADVWSMAKENLSPVLYMFSLFAGHVI